MKAQLRALGFTDDAIREMNPEDAWKALGGMPEPDPQPRSQLGDGNKARSFWRLHGEVEDEPLEDFLVDKTLPKVGAGLLAGLSGTYKSFIAVDLARATFTRTTFAGRQVMRQGGVLYIAAEGQSEFPKRIDGVAQGLLFAVDAQHFDPKHLPFAWANECPRLAAEDAYERLSTVIEDGMRLIQEERGLPVALVIIDAMTSAAGFIDANATSETARVMDTLNRLARKFEVFILVVDHFGKDGG